jgi:hypothetical protein
MGFRRRMALFVPIARHRPQHLQGGYASYGKYIDVSRRAECLVVGLRQPMLSGYRPLPLALLFFTSAIAADLYANHYLTASYCIMPLVAWFVVRMRLVVPIRRDRRISIYRRHVHNIPEIWLKPTHMWSRSIVNLYAT